MKEENVYHIVDLFGNVQQVSWFEYQCWNLLPKFVIFGMLLAGLGVIIDIIKNF
jgi:hypothetical protein